MTGEPERYPLPSFSAAVEPHWSSAGPQNSRRVYLDQPLPAAALRRYSSSGDQSNTVMLVWTGAMGHHHQYPHPHGWQGSAQHHWGRKKQQKELEFSHFCDTCDRGFRTQDKYDEHISQHVKCSVEDCRFTAHEKLVKIHWRNVFKAERLAESRSRSQEDQTGHCRGYRQMERGETQKLPDAEKHREEAEADGDEGAARRRAGDGSVRSPQEPR